MQKTATTKTIPAYAATSAKSPLGPFKFEARTVGPKDIQIEILYCGVCHSDLHIARNEWNFTTYPVVPGHEIVGKVTAVGDQVSEFKVGDIAAVGCMVDSCRTCSCCKEGEEQYCENGFTATYNSEDKHTGGMTYGGYSKQIIVDEAFTLHIPKQFGEKDLPGVAPLLCAGITTYSPLRHWKVGKGTKVGVVGLGGLGHMAIKLAHAMGAHVTLFTTSPGKTEDAKRLGADDVVLSKDADAMSKHQNSLDLIINTVAASHNLDPYVALLKHNGTICLVGLPEHTHPSPSVFDLILKRKSIAGSLIGGIKETQEMLNFCGEHGITCDIEMITIDQINEAYERMLRSDVKYRFVIDNTSLS
ncbi:MAG: NAD(P)-dependent alcohol dehydrogenase [Chlamydiales bacterium]|nr:NAD(P)-dependent alcohol dehydrogenase [Chlamydiia bacterium]MCP5508504.1 NAD(P)-dependent alcohol dehydrogenase [Chlamydiales bacterium]